MIIRLRLKYKSRKEINKYSNIHKHQKTKKKARINFNIHNISDPEINKFSQKYRNKTK